MAGVAGLEPANAGVKVPCLTTWLHPNISFCVLHSELKCGINVITKLIGGNVLWQKKKQNALVVQSKIVSALEAKKQELLRPAKMKKIIEEASASMTPEEMAEKLGIKL